MGVPPLVPNPAVVTETAFPDAVIAVAEAVATTPSKQGVKILVTW